MTLEIIFLIFILIVAPILFPLLINILKVKSSTKSLLYIKLYETLNNDEKFLELYEILNYEKDSPSINDKTIANENFNKALEFLDSSIKTGALEAFSNEELNKLFSKQSELLKRHQLVRKHITKNNYENLAKALNL